VSDPLCRGSEAERAVSVDPPNRSSLQSEERRTEERDSRGIRLARVVVFVGACGIIGVGLLAGGAGFVVALVSLPGDRLSMVTASVSFLILSVGLGSLLAWQAGKAAAGHLSGQFRPRRIWVWILVFVAALVLGQMVLSIKLAALIAFPIFHVLAAGLPPLIILALVGGALGGVTRWREVVLEISSGAFLSTLLAFALEFVAIVAVVAIGLAIVAIQPGGTAFLRTLATRLQDPAWLQNPPDVASWFASPLIVAAALLFVAGLIPAIEEGVKTLGVGLLAYRRPSMPQAVLWGVACGAGFAMAEAMFNTIGGLDGWSSIVLMRVGASLLHCLTGGLMGLGWYYLLIERCWGRIIGLYATALALHGLWNALAAGLAFFPLLAGGERATATLQGFAGLASLGMLAGLALLAIGATLGLTALARHARWHGERSGTVYGWLAGVQHSDRAADAIDETAL
jgi:hypothetical protein